MFETTKIRMRAAVVGIAVVVVGALAAFGLSLDSGSHARDGASAAKDLPASADAVEVSGYDVHVLAARIAPFSAEVDVRVDGRPETGSRLLFAPGPSLVWPDGSVSPLKTLHVDGRMMTLRFDRLSGHALPSGVELKIGFTAVVAADSREAPPALPVTPRYVAAVASEVANPTVSGLNVVQQRLGPGAVRLDEIWQSPDGQRLRGHLVGFTDAEIQSTSLGRSRIVTGAGQSRLPSSSVTGLGADAGYFELDFYGPPLASQRLQVQLVIDDEPHESVDALSRLTSLQPDDLTATLSLPSPVK